jgi:hypothetical protein
MKKQGAGVGSSAEEKAEKKDVGYGKPPKEHQFKAGKSGNPKGKPKGAKGLKSMVCAAAEASEQYVVRGKKTKGSRLQVALHQLSISAAKGNLKAIEKLAQLYAQYGPPPEPDESDIDAEADEKALEEFIAFMTKFGKTGGGNA